MPRKTDWTEITRGYARRVLRDRDFAGDMITDAMYRATEYGGWADFTSADGNTSASVRMRDGVWDIATRDLTVPDTRFETGSVVFDHTEKQYAEVVTPPTRKDPTVTVVYATVPHYTDDGDGEFITSRDPARLATTLKCHVMPQNQRAKKSWVNDVPAAVLLRSFPVGTEVTGARHDFGDVLRVIGHNGVNLIVSNGLETIEGDARYFEPADNPGELHAQFCQDDQDITGSPYEAADATEVRIWAADSTLIIAAQKNARSGYWHVSGSDVCDWTRYAERAYLTYSAAFDAPFAQHYPGTWRAIQRALSA